MCPRCIAFASVASLGLSALLFELSACGGGSSTAQPSYTLTAAALTPATVTAGNMSTSTITVVPASNYGGSVGLSCSVTGGGTPAPSCSFSTSRVPISSAVPGTSTLTVSTSSTTPGGNYSISVTGADANNLAPSNGPQVLSLTMSAVILHVVVIFQ